jgi:hypothetical protein
MTSPRLALNLCRALLSFLSQEFLPELGLCEVLVLGEDSEANNFRLRSLSSWQSSAVHDVLVNFHSEAWVDLLWHLEKIL